MKLAYILFNGATWLDFIGVYDPISRLKLMNYLPDLSWDLCAITKTCADDFGLSILPTKIKNDLSGYDAIIVPGGRGTRKLVNDEFFIDWISSARNTPWKISICTGSLLLGAAGFLKGKKATTHFDEYDTLAQYGANVMKDRIVEDGQVITAGAVSSSLDLGLYLCNKWSGPDAAEKIRIKMHYRG
jgi:cyclohexyl-isocyanide hydratase